MTQQFNTTSSMGRLTLNILLSFAQFEREVTGERIRDKFAASKRKGIWMGGLPPLGYDAKDRKLVVNEPEAEQVRTIFQRYVELGTVAALKQDLDNRRMRSKPRLNAAGLSTGNQPIGQGHLNRILRNRVYIGEITHKGESYPGLHDAIISPELWQAVQDRIDANRHGTRRKSVETSVNPLAGKLVDEAGERLVASHALKKERKYRYYISAFLIRKAEDESRRGWRIPASALESLIQHATMTFLNDAFLMTSTWRQAGAPSAMLPEFIAAICNRIQSGLESNNVYNLIESITLRETGIVLHLDLTSLMPRAPILLHEVPITIARRGLEMRLIHDSQREEPSIPDPTLIKAVARGHRWFEEMCTNHLSATALAKTEGVSALYILRMVRLAFLSPAIVRTIIEGLQPEWLTAQAVANDITIPHSWTDQSVVLLRHNQA